jgi:hypothetical protein
MGAEGKWDLIISALARRPCALRGTGTDAEQKQAEEEVDTIDDRAVYGGYRRLGGPATRGRFVSVDFGGFIQESVGSTWRSGSKKFKRCKWKIHRCDYFDILHHIAKDHEALNRG